MLLFRLFPLPSRRLGDIGDERENAYLRLVVFDALPFALFHFEAVIFVVELIDGDKARRNGGGDHGDRSHAQPHGQLARDDIAENGPFGDLDDDHIVIFVEVGINYAQMDEIREHDHERDPEHGDPDVADVEMPHVEKEHKAAKPKQHMLGNGYAQRKGRGGVVDHGLRGNYARYHEGKPREHAAVTCERAHFLAARDHGHAHDEITDMRKLDGIDAVLHYLIANEFLRLIDEQNTRHDKNYYQRRLAVMPERDSDERLNGKDRHDYKSQKSRCHFFAPFFILTYARQKVHLFRPLFCFSRFFKRFSARFMHKTALLPLFVSRRHCLKSLNMLYLSCRKSFSSEGKS